MRINKVFLNNLAILHPRMLCAELVDIEHVVLAKKDIAFTLFCYYLPLEKGMTFPLNIVEDTLCRV